MLTNQLQTRRGFHQHRLVLQAQLCRSFESPSIADPTPHHHTQRKLTATTRTTLRPTSPAAIHHQNFPKFLRQITIDSPAHLPLSSLKLPKARLFPKASRGRVGTLFCSGYVLQAPRASSAGGYGELLCFSAAAPHPGGFPC